MKIDLYQNLLDALEIADVMHEDSRSLGLFNELSQDYKQNLSKNFLLLHGNEISQKLVDQEFCVTRKIDGELRTIFFNGKETVMRSSSNKEQKDFPCLEEITKICKANGLKNAAFVGELNFVLENNKRTRVTDVIHALANKELHSKLRLSIFDILFIDSKSINKINTTPYKEVHNKIVEIFGKEKNFFVEPIQMEIASTTEEVIKIYKKWVEQEKAEGLVVHSDTQFLWKIKPLHTIDAVALGYTVGEQGVRDILFAVTEKDGTYRLFAHGGNGLTYEQREYFLEKFNEIKCSTNYYYTDSRNVAFFMIKPKYVFEVGAIDFSAEKSLYATIQERSLAEVKEDGLYSPKYNPIIMYSPITKEYDFLKKSPGVSTYSLQILRFRDDKNPIYEDTRVEQISDICPFSEENFPSVKIENLPKSEILYKSVYKKINNASLYVKKFVILKTNKENTKKFSKYLLHISDFSTGRKECIQKVVIPSCSYQQLFEIMQRRIRKEIKTGWILC